MTLLFAYGFRTFFVVAAVVAASVAALWGAALNGVTLTPAVGPYWHAHEMVFGFGGALVAGFVLTAVPNWTKTTRRHGPFLIVLFLLFVAGRTAPFVSGGLSEVLHLAGVLFFFGVGWAIGVPLVKTSNRRNYGVLAIVFGLGLVAAWSVAARTGMLLVSPSRATATGVDLLVLLIAIVGGRITPLFTKNATQTSIRPRGRIDDLAVWGLVAVVILRATAVPAGVLAAALVLAAGVSWARMWGWGTRAAWRNPMLLVLHLGYAWIGLGLALGAASALWPSVLSASTALHALTVGALGTFAIGMMARVSLGHTGRPLRPHPMMPAAFVLVGLAALVRVLGPVAAPAWTPGWHGVASALWAAAFVMFLLVYLPILLRPRADGKVG